jgi:chemotaxis protein CheD
MSGAAGLGTIANDTETSDIRIHVVQGERHVDTRPNVILTTILGSCVAACMRDPVARIGGMNHFLLPSGEGTQGSTESINAGVHAMELLVNGLLRAGARRERLEAKLFGGARMIAGLTDIGSRNAEFATTFLEREGIRFAGGSLGGTSARRVQYWPISGRARQFMVDRGEENVFETERRRPPAPVESSGSLELF